MPSLHEVAEVAHRAAAVAGALVHIGEPVARAARIAEAAMDPAGAVGGHARMQRVQTWAAYVATVKIWGCTPPGPASIQCVEALYF